MQTESKVIILLSSQSKIMASEEKKNSSSDPDNVVQIPLSDYAKKLDGKVGEHYVKKISTIGIDPALIEGKHLTVFHRLNRQIYSVIWFLRPAFTRKSNLKPFAVWNLTIKWFRGLFTVCKGI